MDPALASLFEAVQEACAPGLWSRGVSLSRDLKPLVESRSADEIRLRLPVKDRPVAPLITLWPADAEWHCNCGSKDDPCAHVAAVVIALKAGRVAETGAETPVAGAAAQVIYRFSKAADGALQVERLLRRGQEITPLTSPLTSLVGGRQAGRTSGPPVAAAQADFAAEHALGAWAKRPGPSAPESSAIPTLLKALEDLQSCSYGEAPVRTSGRALTPRARIVDEGPGIRISSIRDASITERFRNGAVLRGGVLHPASSGGLTDEERRLLDGQGTWIAPERLPDFSARILPKLEDKIAIEIETQKLPREPGGPPRVLLYAEEITGEADDDLLAITPRIVYGSPPVAAQSSLARDIPAEQTQALRVQRELQIRVDQPLTLRGSAAAAWVDAHSTAWEIVGPGRARFETRGELTPRLSARELGSDGPELLELSLDFDLNGAKADAGRVIAAWKRGEERVPLLGGGWARLPKEWLK
ncbi:MAG TPA: SWIM zinc finger family protein, partial [Bdellovibrionota bacterium]|nr:SWIM zinc finger family protein [Bdellovibrionota bacterium]